MTIVCQQFPGAPYTPCYMPTHDNMGQLWVYTVHQITQLRRFRMTITNDKARVKVLKILQLCKIDISQIDIVY